MADELLDLVDKNDKVIGTVCKSEAYSNLDLIHRGIAIGIFNDKNEVLLQQRAMRKTSPGSWEISATGHVESGESPINAVRREVHEELGIEIEPVCFDKLFDLDKKHKESKFYWIYYALVKGKPSLALDAHEVMDAQWVKVKELDKFSKSNDYSLSGISHGTIIKMYEHLLNNEYAKESGNKK